MLPPLIDTKNCQHLAWNPNNPLTRPSPHPHKSISLHHVFPQWQDTTQTSYNPEWIYLSNKDQTEFFQIHLPTFAKLHNLTYKLHIPELPIMRWLQYLSLMLEYTAKKSNTPLKQTLKKYNQLTTIPT